MLNTVLLVSPKCVAQISYRALFTTILYLCGKRQIISKLPKLIPKYDFFFLFFFFSSNLSTKGIL